MDRLKIGMFGYNEFKKVINADEVDLRLIDLERAVEDSFDWEQGMIRRILDWILNQRLSLAEAFKLMDANFDGVMTLSDLTSFLRDTFGVDTNSFRVKLERLFRILDLGKTGSIYMVDFENMFTRAYLKRGPTQAKSAGRVNVQTLEPVVDWKQSCLE
jgi:hypothetical protein